MSGDEGEIDPARRQEIAAQYWNLFNQHGEGQAASQIAAQYGLEPADVLAIAAEFPRTKGDNPLARKEEPPDPQPGD